MQYLIILGIFSLVLLGIFVLIFIGLLVNHLAKEGYGEWCCLASMSAIPVGIIFIDKLLEFIF